MTEQKPKIDLKARLGKKTMSSPMSAPVAAGGSTVPPPVGAGVAPAAAAPAPMPAPTYTSSPRPVSPSGVPAPPFTNRPPAAAPAADAANPFGAVAPAAAAPARAPQAIRVELGEEVMEARRSGRKKVAVLAAITALIGGAIGFTAGGGAERAKGAEAALVGAQELVKDIEKANAEVTKLADTLKSAKEKLVKGQYPEEEVSQLGAINIPFSGTNLAGKGIGRFQPDVLSMLIEYATIATEANDQKEKLQSVLSGAKKGLLELLEQKEKPQVRWSAVIADGPNGPWVTMTPITPFSVREKWPNEIKVGSGGKQQEYRRFTGGKVGDKEFLPVDPSSQGSVCPSDVIFKLRRELNDLETVLRGDSSVPGQEKVGLIEAGQKLTQKLKQIGGNKS